MAPGLGLKGVSLSLRACRSCGFCQPNFSTPLIWGQHLNSPGGIPLRRHVMVGLTMYVPRPPEPQGLMAGVRGSPSAGISTQEQGWPPRPLTPFRVSVSRLHARRAALVLQLSCQSCSFQQLSLSVLSRPKSVSVTGNSRNLPIPLTCHKSC